MRSVVRLRCRSLAGIVIPGWLAACLTANAMAAGVSFEIAASDAATALERFAAQAHMQLLFDYKAAARLRTPELKGHYEPSEALRILLRGSGFTFQQVNDYTVAVKAPGEVQVPAGAAVSPSSQGSSPESGKNPEEGKTSSSGAGRVPQAAQEHIPRAAGPAVQVLPRSEPSGGPLEEVVVTAEKRHATLQSVPMSLTALSGATLDNIGAKDFADYAQTIPGLSFASGGPGLNRMAIRGISSSGGSSATVGYYIDDTPIQDIRYNADPELVDLSRVEVLRGPQGTLYGSGSMGGTVKLVTNQPTFNEWSGSVAGEVSGTRSGGINAEGSAVLNAPLVTDRAAARIVIFDRKNAGFIDRVEPDPTMPTAVNTGSATQRGVNVFESFGLRTAVALRPTDHLTITPSVFYQRFTLSNPDTVDVPPATASNLVQVRISPEPEFDSFTLASLSTRYSLASADIVSTTSYYTRHQSAVEDASRFIFSVFYPQQTYLLPTTDTENRGTRSFVEELRLQSTGKGRLEWLVGVFYSKLRVPFDVYQPGLGFNEAFNIGLPGSDELIFGEHRTVDTRETAGFGQASYELAKRLTATAGVRVSGDKQTFVDTQTGLFASNSTDVGASSETSVNPKYELSYELTSHTLTYATAARGFRLGGPITPPPVQLCSADLQGIGLAAAPSQYNSDHVWSYELGTKSNWWNNSLVVNAAAYTIQWSQIQQVIHLEKCGYNYTGNAGSATSKGGELELRAAPLSGLQLAASASYTDAAIDRPGPGTGIQPGQAVLETPRWNLSDSIEFRRPFGAAREAFVHFDTAYTTHAQTYFVTTDPAYRRSGYSLSNFRIGLVDKRWELAFFMKNIFDRFAILQYPTPLTADAPYYRRASIEQPRVFGVTGRVLF